MNTTCDGTHDSAVELIVFNLLKVVSICGYVLSGKLAIYVMNCSAQEFTGDDGGAA